MANDELVLDLDWNITKAKAKIDKLKQEYKSAKKELESNEIEIDLSSKSIEKTKEKLKRLKSELEVIHSANRQTAIEKGWSKVDRSAYKAKKAEIEEQNRLLAKQEAAHRKQEVSLIKQKAKIKDIGNQIVVNTKGQNKFTQAFKKSQQSADSFGKRLKSLVSSALFFTLVTKALTALREEFGKLINEEGTKTAKLAAQLKGNLAVLGRTLYESAKPYIEWMLSSLVKMVNVLTVGLAKVLGKNVNEMKKLTEQTQKANKEAQKTTASFDTLQTAGGSSASSSNTADNSTAASLDFSALNQGVTDEIALLMAALSGAVLILGVILTFTGANIPLGLGLIAAGAVGMTASLAANWGTMNQKTKDVITGIMGLGGLLFLALGLILILTGAGIPLGIGFILLGAAALGVATALSPGDTIVEKIKNVFSNIKNIFKSFIEWVSVNLFDNLFGKAYGKSLGDMFEAFISLFEDIITFFVAVFSGDWKTAWKSLVNIFIDILNIMISQINLVIQFFLGGGAKLINLLGKAFGQDWKLNADWAKIPKIPRLATGAVLPGGSPMLAWVNDQPKGQPYVEGSVENIAAAFEKYLGNNSGNKTYKVEAKGNMAQLLRYLALEITEENDRVSVF